MEGRLSQLGGDIWVLCKMFAFGFVFLGGFSLVFVVPLAFLSLIDAWAVIMMPLIFGTLMVLYTLYEDWFTNNGMTFRDCWNRMLCETFLELGFIREKGQLRQRLFGVRPPVEYEPNGGLINFIKPFSVPPISQAFALEIRIDLPKLSKYLQLTEEEKSLVEKWRVVPYRVDWQQWSGGYERLRVSFREIKTDQVFDHEFNSYQDDRVFPWAGGRGYTLWTEEIGEAQIELEIGNLREEMRGAQIRLSLWGGRFEPEPSEPWDSGPRQPKLEWTFMIVPLAEERLDIFEERREEPISWEPHYGRPCKRYYHEDNQRGVHWFLTYYFDMRPLVRGRVEKGGLISYDCGSGFGSEPRRIRQRYHPGDEQRAWAEEGDEVYIVFDTEGQIDYLWPVDEIQRQVRGEPAKEKIG